jgi:type I restriction enzyme S subunit
MGNQLPKGWAETSLMEISSKLVDGSHIPPFKTALGKPMLSARNVRDGEIIFDEFRFIGPHAFDVEDRRTNVRPGDVLLTIVGTIGRSAVVLEGTEYFTLQRSVAVLRPIGFSPKLLMYSLQAPQTQKELQHLSRGSAQKGLYLKSLAQLAVRLPPFNEGKQIVAEIEKQFTRLEAGVGALKRVQANLKRYRAAVLKAAVEGRLVPTEAELARREGRPYEPASELLARMVTQPLLAVSKKAQAEVPVPLKPKSKEPVLPDTANLPKLPEGWECSAFRMLIIEGPQNGLYLPKSAYGGGIPILRIDDFQDGWSRNSNELRQVHASSAEEKCYSLKAGDLVINRVNSPSHLGKTLLVDRKNLPALFESNMMRLRLATALNSRFIEMYLRSKDGRARLIERAKWAVNQASINQTDVGLTLVPVAPLAEQNRIVAEVERRLSVIEELEMQVEANLKRAERLRQAILKRAFEGKLVPQGPNDEPASALLERIRHTKLPETVVNSKRKKTAALAGKGRPRV